MSVERSARHLGAAAEIDLELVVVDHLGDLADQPAAGDDGVAAADRRQHLAALLHCCRCGRMIRKYMITKIRTNGRMLIEISGVPPPSTLRIGRRHEH